jgi:alpha-1,3-mannosyl-glycoprotein beta-1,2-N-acetylglucosaminyltransferase
MFNRWVLIIVHSGIDDLEISPDFFEYFAATLPIMRQDPSIWCVSAWNDNGKPQRINSTAHDLLYRSDFFPGLGWMMTKNLWKELMVKWPRGLEDKYLSLCKIFIIIL